MNNTYNGWTNRETWLVNLWLGDLLSETTNWDAETLEDFVTEFLDPPTTGLLADLCGLWRVAWEELAEEYNSACIAGSI